VILDNGTTAMTGSQPTPASGFGARGEPLAAVQLPQIVTGCGVTFCETADPYHLPEFTALLKRAAAHAREHGPAVVIARHPCILDRRYRQEATEVAVTEDCDGCGFCVTRFECPAMAVTGEGEEARMEIDAAVCNGCGVCLHICPRESIRAKEGA
jgi:indolepyruvate ferredoxin oxidoreductase alpha subunit